MYLLKADDGVISEEQLEGMGVGDWVNWLRARGSSYDEFTGEHLRGAPAPYALVLASVLRIEAANTVFCFEEACAHIVERFLGALKRAQELGRREEFVLVSVLDVLGRVAATGSESSPPVASVSTWLIGHLRASLEAEDGVEEKRMNERVVAAAVRFFDLCGRPVPENLLLRTLGVPQASRFALHILCRRSPGLEVFYWQEFIARLVARGATTHVDLEVRSRTARDGAVATRRFLLAVMRSLDDRLIELFDQLEGVIEVRSYSETREKLRKHQKIFFSYKGYLDGLETEGKVPERVIWARELRREILSAARAFAGMSVQMQEVAPETEWDQQAVTPSEEGAPLIQPLDPIFLSPRRVGSISLVPYGVCRGLCVIYMAADPASDVPDYVESLEVLERIFTWDFEIGTIDNTAAEAELWRLRLRSGLGTKPLHRRHEIPALAQWLTEQPSRRVVVADIGFFRGMEKAVEGKIVKKRVNYQRPVLVGVPFKRGDLAWGEVLRDVVAKVLYIDNWITKGELRAGLSEAEIDPLTEEVWNGLPESVTESVEEEVLPFRGGPVSDGVAIASREDERERMWRYTGARGKRG